MKETWYLLKSTKHSASYNMALDECLLNWHSEGKIHPTIRFYEWETPTLSAGYFQKVSKELDVEHIKHQEISLVRRLTGGRAVLHDNELTYSVIVSEDHPDMPKTIVHAYRVLSNGLLKGFRALGLQADFAIPQTEEEQNALKSPRSAVCFDAPSYYELVVEGRKIAGSAQTRQKGVILQHGSIPLTIDLHFLYSLFTFPNEKIRERMKNAFTKKAAAINELTENTFTRSQLQEAFIHGFEEALNIQFTPFQLSPEQEKEVLQLAKEKYENDSWTFKY